MKRNIYLVLLLSIAAYSYSQEAWNGFTFGASLAEVRALADQKLAPYEEVAFKDIEYNDFKRYQVLVEIYKKDDFMQVDGSGTVKPLFDWNLFSTSKATSLWSINSRQPQFRPNYFGDICFYFDNNCLVAISVAFSANSDVLLDRIRSASGEKYSKMDIVRRSWNGDKYNWYKESMFKWETQEKLILFRKESSTYWVVDAVYSAHQLEEVALINKEKAEAEKAAEVQKALETTGNLGF